MPNYCTNMITITADAENQDSKNQFIECISILFDDKEGKLTWGKLIPVKPVGDSILDKDGNPIMLYTHSDVTSLYNAWGDKFDIEVGFCTFSDIKEDVVKGLVDKDFKNLGWMFEFTAISAWGPWGVALKKLQSTYPKLDIRCLYMEEGTNMYGEFVANEFHDAQYGNDEIIKALIDNGFIPDSYAEGLVRSTRSLSNPKYVKLLEELCDCNGYKHKDVLDAVYSSLEDAQVDFMSTPSIKAGTILHIIADKLNVKNRNTKYLTRYLRRHHVWQIY